MKLADRASYYAADGKLYAADYRTLGVELGDVEWSATFEEYRYDALGRRIWLRSRRFCERRSIAHEECKLSYVRRTVWDGDAELYEIQMPGASGTPVDTLENDTAPVRRILGSNSFDGNRFFGRMAYAYGLGLDQPVTIVRFRYADATDGVDNPKTWAEYPTFTIVPLWNVRGSAETGLLVAPGATRGFANYCLPADATRCVRISFDGFYEVYGPITPLVHTYFHGSLLIDKLDKAQTLYRRNRTYDPKTGRFTQEDPIGLAGGMNLYGFAAGDPVNFSDPFGLGPCPEGHEEVNGFCYDPAAALGAGISATMGTLQTGLNILINGTRSLNLARGAALGEELGAALRTQKTGKMAGIAAGVSEAGLSQAGAVKAAQTAVKGLGLRSNAIRVGDNVVVASVQAGRNMPVLVVERGGRVVYGSADLSYKDLKLIVENVRY